MKVGIAMTSRRPSREPWRFSEAEALYRIRETSISTLQLQSDLEFQEAAQLWDMQHAEFLQAYRDAIDALVREAWEFRPVLYMDELLDALDGAMFADLGLDAPEGVVEARAGYGEWSSDVYVDPPQPTKEGRVIWRAHTEISLGGQGHWDSTAEPSPDSPFISHADLETMRVELAERQVTVAFAYFLSGSPLGVHLETLTLEWAQSSPSPSEDWQERFVDGEYDDGAVSYVRYSAGPGYRPHQPGDRSHGRPPRAKRSR